MTALDRIAGDYKNRSDIIENALRAFLRRKARALREKKDLQILNSKAEALNEEAEDVLSYQVEL